MLGRDVTDVRRPGRHEVLGRAVDRVVAGLVAGATAAGLVLAASAPVSAEHVAGAPDDGPRLHLVTLAGPGTAVGGGDVAGVTRARLLERQDALLATVGSPAVVYRWTTALNGVAVRLGAAQARSLASDPRVALVEASALRPLAGGVAAGGPAAALRPPGPARGGRGTVIGVVDTGIDPRSAAFATLPTLGPRPADFAGACAGAARGPGTSDCGGKVAAARWYVEGFGRGSLRSGSSLSPRDDVGHGTQVASIAAGNADVPVRVPGQHPTTAGGQAPDARLAVYKACWSAPDPADDGCTTADLVAAVDRAVADGVDVLSLSVADRPDDPRQVDTLDRALLGAAEAGVVVVAAAGNDPDGSAAYAVPWVTTVGAAAGTQPAGVVEVVGGPRFRGVTAARGALPPAPLTTGEAAAADGADPRRARVCAPGSLDASAVSGRVVVCERGRVGRVDKSATVGLADGAGMVLVNRAGPSAYADFHAVPTVHLAAGPGRDLLDLLRREPEARAGIVPTGRGRGLGPAAPSSPGDPDGTTLKPDVVAPASGLLGAMPSTGDGPDWDVAAGTSAATAWTAGAAATLRARQPGWDAVEVRSALVTRSLPAAGGHPLASGAGRVDVERAADVRLTYPQPAAGYRDWLDGDGPRPNTPSVLLGADDRTATRTLRNTADEALYFSSDVRGFSTRVRVRPLAVRLGPGEEASFTVRAAAGPRARVDDGYVVWRGGDRSRSRIPVVLAP